jgi:hypothetical protein
MHTQPFIKEENVLEIYIFKKRGVSLVNPARGALLAEQCERHTLMHMRDEKGNRKLLTHLCEA